eukprot:TRINITY_DN105558_c0_g1_i1.p1 TRINITY_DN105558_c0_g1~~TRINITY_DN105558_c0_g1_i1.p1  ORF type:complete len:575 (-),score=109.28 TRINITY_DN105558_c0_g1_i1:310-2034(-)
MKGFATVTLFGCCTFGGIALKAASSKNVGAATFPVAPQDDLTKGLQIAADRTPPGSSPPKLQAAGTMEGASIRGQILECHSSPQNWQDSHGNGCYEYEKGQWCTREGVQGPGWQAEWGTFMEWTASMANNGPKGACCACGGGVPMVSSTQSDVPLARSLVMAPEDAVARRDLVAPADALPEKFGMAKQVTAPLDAVPRSFRRHFAEMQKQRQTPDLMGLTVRFYDAPPTNTCEGPPTISSAVDRVLDYGLGKVSGFQRFVESRAKKAKTGSVFYAKWTGTIDVLAAGEYAFDLDLGFDTQSSVKIDGKEILTKGQCRVARDAGACSKKRCSWVAESCVPPTLASFSAPVAAPAAVVAASPSAELSLIAQGHHAAPAAAPAESPAAAPGLAAFSPAAAMPAAPAPEVGQQPSTAYAPAPAPFAAAPPAFEAVGGSVVVSTDPDGPGRLTLKAGGHCVEIVVMAQPTNSPTMQLRYSGPDTDQTDTLVPGQVLFCDPVAPACKRPELDACRASRPNCEDEEEAVQAAPVAAPGPAPLAAQLPTTNSIAIPAGWSVPTLVKPVAAVSASSGRLADGE